MACDDIARQSGRSLSNFGTLFAMADALAARAAARGERALLVVATDDRRHELAARIALAVGAEADADPSGRDRADRLLARLGGERERLVHDARSVLDPALLAAEAGTVVAGGVLVLLLSPRELFAGTDGTARRAPRFDARFARRLARYLDTNTETSARVALVDGAPLGVTTAAPEPVPARAVRRSPDRAARDAQDAMLERLLRHLGEALRPAALIVAPRGHGKSALLGRLAARLDAASGVDYAVCAARRSTLAVLERHRRAARSVHPRNIRPLPFRPPDVARARGGELLLVDEAASLPLDTLAQLLARYRAVVLATTVQGHESAGRAAALRLPPLLTRERGAWLRLEPAAPMRWRAGDPLERFLVETLLLEGAAVAGDGNVAPGARDAALATPPSVRELDREVLAVDERRLREVFALLVATHYQSTALDLRHLLDAPLLRLWSAEADGRTIGVALVALEPGIAPALHADILARRRRPPHRLLPQLLAQCADRADALAVDHARVLRIAVDPQRRRRGVGSALLAAVARDLGTEVEALGASFGESDGALAFWRANGYAPFHRGARRNPRSGNPSIAVLRARSARVAPVLERAVAAYRDNEAARLGQSSPVAVSPARDRATLARFARGERGLADARAALLRLYRASSAGPTLARLGDDSGAALLVALGRDADLGRRARERALREWVAERLGPEEGPAAP